MTDTHDHPEANQLGVKVEIGMIFVQDFPQMWLELNNGTSHTINVHIFLKTLLPNTHLGPSERPMNPLTHNYA